MAPEIETKLVVLADDPGKLMIEIACRETLGDYRMRHLGRRTFTDTYYDEPGRLLGARGIAVRTRDTGGSIMFCIKHSERVREDGTAFREELETADPVECVRLLKNILCGESPESTPLLQDTYPLPPTFKGLGLSAIQKRITRRDTCEIFCAMQAYPVAELAMDTVRYRLGGTEIGHCEMEVEAKSPSDPGHAARFTELLRTAYPDALGVWRHNKLLTGFALERLMEDEMFASLLCRAGSIPRPAYDALDAYLKNRQW